MISLSDKLQTSENYFQLFLKAPLGPSNRCRTKTTATLPTSKWPQQTGHRIDFNSIVDLKNQETFLFDIP